MGGSRKVTTSGHANSKGVKKSTSTSTSTTSKLSAIDLVNDQAPAKDDAEHMDEDKRKTNDNDDDVTPDRLPAIKLTINEADATQLANPLTLHSLMSHLLGDDIDNINVARMLDSKTLLVATDCTVTHAKILKFTAQEIKGLQTVDVSAPPTTKKFKLIIKNFATEIELNSDVQQLLQEKHGLLNPHRFHKRNDKSCPLPVVVVNAKDETTYNKLIKAEHIKLGFTKL
eukprot:Pgem_evm1s7216